MFFSIAILIIAFILSLRAAPREREEDVHIHGAGQIGVLAAIALFGVDYFTSYYYATGEMMSALHPYGLQGSLAYFAVAIIAFANFTFGSLYMYSLGPFDEGGGSYTASMRYLKPLVSLIVAVTLIQDYVLTIVVSALSGGDQLLSIINAYDAHWIWHFAIGASSGSCHMVSHHPRARESARVVFTMLGVFILLTITLGVGLLIAYFKGVPPVPPDVVAAPVSLGQALLHLLTASMKGMVALTGLEAVSNGVQFMINDDVKLVKWGKQHMPRLNRNMEFLQWKIRHWALCADFLPLLWWPYYAFLTFFSLRFNVFDGTFGRTLVGNMAFIGFQPDCLVA